MNQNDQKETERIRKDRVGMSSFILETPAIKQVVKDLCEIKRIFEEYVRTAKITNDQETIDSMFYDYLNSIVIDDGLQKYITFMKDTDRTISKEYVICDIEENKNYLLRDFRITQNQERKGSI